MNRLNSYIHHLNEFYLKVGSFCILMFAANIPCYSQHELLQEYKQHLDSSTFQKLVAGFDTISELPLEKRGMDFRNLGTYISRYSNVVAIDLYHEALDVFTQAGNDTLYNTYLGTTSFFHVALGQEEESLQVLDSVNNYWLTHEDPNMLAHTYKKYGWHHYYFSDFPRALEYYYKSINLFEQIDPNHRFLPDLLNRVGILLNTVGNHQGSYEVLQKCIDRIDKGELPMRYKRMISYNLLTAIEALEEVPDSIDIEAIRDDVIEGYKKRKSTKSQVTLNSFLFNKYYQQGNCEELKKVLADHKFHSDKYDDYSYRADAGLLGAEYETLCGQLDKVIDYLEVAEYWQEKLGDLKKSRKICDAYVKYYENKNDINLAYTYKKRSDSIESIILSENKLNYLSQLSVEQIQKNAKNEIDALMLKFQNQEDKLDWQKKMTSLGVGITVFALGIGAWLYLLYRSRRKISDELAVKNKDLEKSLEENQFLIKEIHHRVKNNLQVVSSLLNLQKNFEKDETVIKALNTGKERVQSISILHKTLYNQSDLNAISVKLYLEELVYHLVSTYQNSKTPVDLKQNIVDIKMNVDTLVPVGLITNELITNSFKYGLKNHLSPRLAIELKSNSDHYILSVSDNGSGFPFEKLPAQSDSLGIQLIQSFASRLDGDITIYNDNGAVFKITFPKSSSDVLNKNTG